MYEVIATGSKGNCIIYHGTIAVDMGIPYAQVSHKVNDLQIVLLTHIHGDHFNLATIKRLSFERPALRFVCGEFLADKLEGVRNVDVVEAGKIYNYGSFKISPIVLYHNVKNFGYRIFKGETKILHATDTAHLEGITAKGYDLYAIEHNWNEDTAPLILAEKQLKGEFSHIKGAMNSHLSEQQAREFIFKNKSEHSQILRLHESKST